MKGESEGEGEGLGVILLGGKKPKASGLRKQASKPEPEPEEEDDDEELAPSEDELIAAEELLAAVAKKDAPGVVLAMRGLITCCGEAMEGD